MLHLVFAGDEIPRSGHPCVALLLHGGQRVGIHLAIVDDLVNDFGFALQFIGGSEGWDVLGILAAASRRPVQDEFRRPRPGQPRFRNRVRVFADLILQMGAIFVNLVGIDRATILQMDDFGRSADCAQQQSPKITGR